MTAITAANAVRDVRSLRALQESVNHRRPLRTRAGDRTERQSSNSIGNSGEGAACARLDRRAHQIPVEVEVLHGFEFVPWTPRPEPSPDELGVGQW